MTAPDRDVMSELLGVNSPWAVTDVRLTTQPSRLLSIQIERPYGSLQGQRTGQFRGPMTFGEIGYQLLNQTLVYLSLVDA